MYIPPPIPLNQSTDWANPWPVEKNRFRAFRLKAETVNKLQI
jgi:hypothetical protein